MTLTDAQVVEILAKQEGVGRHLHCVAGPTREHYKCGYCALMFVGVRDELCEKRPKPPYLTSRDALAPVLAGLSEDEWFELVSTLSEESQFDDASEVEMAKWLLTLPPADLARAIASVLQEGEGVAK